MSNPPITNTISAFVQSQVPEFIRSNPNSNFVAFLQAYYEWMEQNSNTAGIVYNSKQLPSYWDVDKTSTQFIQHFINQFLPFFPNNPSLSEDKLIKLSREFYEKKGSANSIQFLFRVLYGKEVSIYYPKQQVLKCSDGKWFQPQILRLEVDPVLTANGFNYQQLVGRQGLGSISNASCVIESATVELDPAIGATVVELFVSNVNRQFSAEDNLNVIFGFAPNGAPLIFSEPILSSIDAVVLAPPGEGGLQYRGESSVYTGDPITFIGGLGTHPSATKAIGYVQNVTSGSITGIIVNDGRFYYRLGANTLVQVINAPGDNTGGNAVVDVLGIDAANSLFVNVQTDAIQFYQNTALNAASYNFPNFPGSNVNTMLSTAFSYANLQFGNITTMGVVSGGNNFQAPPSFSLQVVYWTDYTNALAGNGSNLFSYSLQPIDDLGWIAGVEIGFGGNGYSNVTDQIVSTSTIGQNAVFTFQTAPTTNAINRVDVTARGNGYIQLPFQLAIVNSANNMNVSAGQGAQLTAYGFGQGAQLQSSVDKIGAILSFYLTSRGFDYITTPRVSMRNVDIALVDPGANLTFQGDSVVFQGANANSASFAAKVDFYTQKTSVLRLYDFQGAFVANANLITTSGNVTINTANTNVQNTYFKYYGNGLANANAIFIPGLEQLPGFYLTTDGQPSADQFLQDSTIYHNYSYKVVVEQTLNQFKKTLMDLVHPAGMSLVVQSTVTTTDQDIPTLNISVQVEPNANGLISARDILGGNVVIGLNVGDAIGIDNGFNMNNAWTGINIGNTVPQPAFLDSGVANAELDGFQEEPRDTNYDTTNSGSIAIYMAGVSVNIPPPCDLWKTVSFVDKTGNTIVINSNACNFVVNTTGPGWGVWSYDPPLFQYLAFGGYAANSSNLIPITWTGVQGGTQLANMTANTYAAQPTFTGWAAKGLLDPSNNVGSIDNLYIVSTAGQNLQILDLFEVRTYVNTSANTSKFVSQEITMLTQNLAAGHPGQTNIFTNLMFTTANGGNVVNLRSQDAVFWATGNQASWTWDISIAPYLLLGTANGFNTNLNFSFGPVSYPNTVNVLGQGTHFTTNVIAGDMIMFNTHETDRKLQVKFVANVTNDTFLTLTTNTTWIFTAGANVSNGSNVITGPYLQGNVGITDVIGLNIAGNLITGTVTNVTTLNTITTDTVYGQNANGLMMAIYPSFNLANYTIMHAPS